MKTKFSFEIMNLDDGLVGVVLVLIVKSVRLSAVSQTCDFDRHYLAREGGKFR